MPRKPSSDEKENQVSRNITVVEQFEREIPQKNEFRIFEIVGILDITKRRVSQMCNEGKFDYFDEEGFQEGAYKLGNSWRIKRQGIIEYLRRINQ